jgi:hypothetical protein
MLSVRSAWPSAASPLEFNRVDALTSDLSLIFQGCREQPDGAWSYLEGHCGGPQLEVGQAVVHADAFGGVADELDKAQRICDHVDGQSLGEDGLQHVTLVLGPVELAESAACTANVPHGRVALQLDIAFAKREAVAAERDAVF